MPKQKSDWNAALIAAADAIRGLPYVVDESRESFGSGEAVDRQRALLELHKLKEMS